MFSNWKNVPNSANINFQNYLFSQTFDGTKAFYYSGIDSNFYYTNFNGSVYTNWELVPNQFGVAFIGSFNTNIILLLFSKDGTTLFAQNGNGNTDSNIYYAKYNGTAYTSWAPIPNPATITFNKEGGNGFLRFSTSPDGTKIIVQSLDADYNLYCSLWNGATYSNWTVLPNAANIDFTNSLNTKTNTDCTKIVMYSKANTEIYYALYTGSTYTNWAQIPNDSAIIFESNADYILTFSADGTKVFALDAFSAVYYSLYNAGLYSSWTAVQNPTMINFEVSITPRSNIDGTKIFNKDTDNNYYYAVYNGAGYSSWAQIPNAMSVPLLNSSLTYYFTDSAKIFLQTADNNIYYSLYKTSTGYSSWQLVPNKANLAWINFNYNVDGTFIFNQTNDAELNSYYSIFNGSDYSNWTLIPNAPPAISFNQYLIPTNLGTTVFNQITDTLGNFYYSLYTPRPTPAISNICFVAGTLIKTDQGQIAIELIHTDYHTINKKPIVAITKTVTLDKFLICIEPHALYKNYPNKRTIISKDHLISYKRRMMPASSLLDYSDNVKRVSYNGETLYNVLMGEYTFIEANNLKCETLHPDNIIAKLYKSNLSETNKNDIICLMNEALIQRDVESYKSIVNSFLYRPLHN